MKYIFLIATLVTTVFLNGGNPEDLKRFKNTGECPRCDLSNEYLSKITHKLKAAGKKINLEGANLQGAQLFRACLDGANLKEANLTYANLDKADIHDANLIGTDLADASLRECYMTHSSAQFANFYKADLTKASVSHTNLSYAKFAKANLTQTGMWGAIFTNALLYKTILTSAKFHGAKGLDKTYCHYPELNYLEQREEEKAKFFAEQANSTNKN